MERFADGLSWDLTKTRSEITRSINHVTSHDTPYSSYGNVTIRLLRRYVLRFHFALVLFWLWVLHWGERTVFNQNIESCRWEHWESWPTHARPHHVAFLADPQLVDPHTYPGRPWPLSSLTVAFTDKYMKRSYKTIQRDLNPESVLFLGDLFDGGREWSTETKEFTVSEKQWKSYGQNFWLNEYNRFGRIFLAKDQVTGGMPDDMARQKNIIASLPGNHDLGFASGVQPVVRDRFKAYFGNPDRVDIVGNHTFVSLDTVSLSAMQIPDASQEIWKPTMDFLDNVQQLKQEQFMHELRSGDEEAMPKKYAHEVAYVKESQQLHPRQRSHEGIDVQLPTIVLTHVPFFRESGTPCGPLREKYPPSAPDLDVDERNAIRVAAGYQYQNVLTRELSRTIAEKVGNVARVFSGDDHDYCEVVHRAYPSAGGGIKEITVKSMSIAMGVRKPGFLLASLWNPIDEAGRPLPDNSLHTGDDTVQTHLCLLPDELGILIKYASYIVCTLLAIAVHAGVLVMRKTEPLRDSEPMLPTSEPKKYASNVANGRSRASSGSAHSESKGLLSARSQGARARTMSPMAGSGGYGLPSVQEYGNGHTPLIHQAGYYGKKHDLDYWADDMDEVDIKPASRRQRGIFARFFEQFGLDLLVVACPSLAWYAWLMSTG